MKHNPRRRLEKKSVTEQAAEWLMALEDQGAEANAAFSDWLRESPTHVQAYLRAATLDTLLKRIDPQRSMEIVRPEAGAVTPDIEPQVDSDLFEPLFRTNKKRIAWRVAASAAAAGLLLAVGWGAFSLTGGSWKTYQTSIGEQRAVELQDGSTLTLNTDSQVQVRFTGSERQLRLLEGEAIFRVQRDPSRPFRVHSGNSVVQAVGTEFTMYRKADQTTVSVLEGRVAVMSADASAAIDEAPAHPATGRSNTRAQSVYLNAGEGLLLSNRGQVRTKSRIDVAKVTSWRQRRLVFIDEPLHSIGYELNRYNRSPKIRVQGAGAQQRRYAVILDADDPESLVAVLSKDPRITVERRSGEIVVRER